MKSHKKDNKYRGSSKQRSVDIFSSVVNISYDAKKNWAKKETKNPWNKLLDSYNFHCCFDLSQCTVMQCLPLINQTSEISPRVLEEKVAQLKSAAIEDLKEREEEKRKLLERNDQVRDFRSRWERVVFFQIKKYICDHFKLNFSLSQNLLERYCGGLSGTQHKTGQKVLFQSSFFLQRALRAFAISWS